MYLNYVKSFFDFIAAFIGLIVLSPLIIVITILLFILNNGKPFYFQNRPGYKEKIFRIIKFKTRLTRCRIQIQILLGPQKMYLFYGVFENLNDIPVEMQTCPLMIRPMIQSIPKTNVPSRNIPSHETSPIIKRPTDI